LYVSSCFCMATSMTRGLARLEIKMSDQPLGGHLKTGQRGSPQ